MHYGKLKQGQANTHLVSSSPNVTDINVYLEGYDENLLSRPVEWKIFNGINNLKMLMSIISQKIYVLT